MATSNHQSQPASRRVVIAGATGLVGQYILQNLLACIRLEKSTSGANVTDRVD